MNLEKIISGKHRAPVCCHLFEGVLWGDREATLVELGFKPIRRSDLHELSKHDAERHLEHALSKDLCCGSKLMGASDALDLAQDFTARLHWQTRYFSNTRDSLPLGSGSFAFRPLSDATIDTGVIAKAGDQFAGLFWVFSYD